MPVAAHPLFRRDGLLADQVFKHLSEAIASGELRENEPLHDADIAAAFGVSRTPVREALLRLQRMGLVEAIPHVGTKVAAVDDELVRQTLEFSGLQASMIVAAAVPKLSTADRAHACELVQALIDASDPGVFFRAGREFVGFLTERCENVLLQQAIVDTRIVVLRNLRHITPVLGAAQERAAGYRRLQDAVRRGDGEEAAAAFRAQHRLPLQSTHSSDSLRTTM